MGLLSDKFDKEKPAPTYNATNPAEGSASSSGPPSYDQSGRDHPSFAEDGSGRPSDDEIRKVNLTGAFDSLSLETDTGPVPNGDTCLAHLKLLFAIQGMKEEVGYMDGLWNIWDSRADNEGEAIPNGAGSTHRHESGSQAVPDQRLATLSKLREKRWAIFLARAVDRYAAWWSSFLSSNGGLVQLDMQSPNSPKYSNFVGMEGNKIDGDWITRSLPPLGTYLLCPGRLGLDSVHVLTALQMFLWSGMRIC